MPSNRSSSHSLSLVVMAFSKNQASSGSFFSSPLCFQETLVPIHGHSKSQTCLRKIMEIILYDSSTACLLKPCDFQKPPRLKLDERKSESFEIDEEHKKHVDKVSCKENEKKIDLRLMLGLPKVKEVNLRENGDFDGDSDSVCSAIGKAGEIAGKTRSNCCSSVQRRSEGENDQKSGENLLDNFELDREEVNLRDNEDVYGDSGSVCSAIGKVGEFAGKVDRNCNSSVQSSYKGEHDRKSVENLPESFELDREEEEGKDFSEITILQSSEGKCDERSRNTEHENEKTRKEEEKNYEVIGEVKEQEKRRSEGYLDLLIEAIRFVSGNLIEVETESIPVKSKSIRSSNNGNNKRCWWMLEGLLEDSAPIVKSKRGRNQVLPSRYRDSVLDPWKRLPRFPRSKLSKP